MPNPTLKPHQEQLLRELLAAGKPVAADEVDGRVLRPLRALKLVVVRNGHVIPTAAARVMLRVSPGEAVLEEEESSALSDAQQDLIWSLARRGSPALADHLDGRVTRPLLERGLLSQRNGWVYVTVAGQEWLAETRVARRRAAANPRTRGEGRAGMIWRALEQLEDAIPSAAEIRIGKAIAYGDDVLLALRRAAREMKREK